MLTQANAAFSVEKDALYTLVLARDRSVAVSMSACLFVHVSQNRSPSFTTFSVYVQCGRCVVLNIEGLSLPSDV